MRDREKRADSFPARSRSLHANTCTHNTQTNPHVHATRALLRFAHGRSRRGRKTDRRASAYAHGEAGMQSVIQCVQGRQTRRLCNRALFTFRVAFRRQNAPLFFSLYIVFASPCILFLHYRGTAKLAFELRETLADTGLRARRQSRRLAPTFLFIYFF